MPKLTDEQKALIKSYGHLFTSTGGNDIVELMERGGVSYFNNALVAECQGCCWSQLRLLQQLAPTLNKLRSALEGLVGESNPDELRKMKVALSLPTFLEASAEDMKAMLVAIDTLLEIPYA